MCAPFNTMSTPDFIYTNPKLSSCQHPLLGCGVPTFLITIILVPGHSTVQVWLLCHSHSNSQRGLALCGSQVCCYRHGCFSESSPPSQLVILSMYMRSRDIIFVASKVGKAWASLTLPRTGKGGPASGPAPWALTSRI